MILADLGGPFPCLLVLAFVVIAVVVAITSVIQARKRREAMERLAAQLGLTYYADDPWDIPARYAHLDLFDEGHSRQASNILAGVIDGREVLAFDYRYTTGSGKNRTTHYHQAALMGLPIVASRLRMRREGVLDRMASWVGYDDLDFESEAFSNKYYVKCEDRKFAYDIFHARLIEYLLACGEAPAMEMNGPLLLVHDSRRGPENLQRLLVIGRQIVASIPEYVLMARGIRAKQGGEG